MKSLNTSTALRLNAIARTNRLRLHFVFRGSHWEAKWLFGCRVTAWNGTLQDMFRIANGLPIG